MTKEYWKTTATSPFRQVFHWPTWGQIGRQLALVLVIGVIWGALFVGFASLTSADPTSLTQFDPTATTALVAAPTPTPTSVREATPTLIPSPTTTSEPTAIPEALVTPTATDTPPPAPTDTPVPSPTDTPLSPTDTPLPIEESIQVSFANDVFPILERRCLKCHGGDKVENGLSMQSYETVLKGSWNGAVIKPGDVEGSYLIDQIVSGEMPKRGPRLLPAEIETISAWVAAGAPDN
jgi:hypothetical protein